MYESKDNARARTERPSGGEIILSYLAGHSLERVRTESRSPSSTRSLLPIFIEAVISRGGVLRNNKARDAPPRARDTQCFL